MRKPKAKPQSKPAPAPAPPALAEEPAILQRLDAPSKWNMAMVATGLTIAAGLSLFAIRGWMRKAQK